MFHKQKSAATARPIAPRVILTTAAALLPALCIGLIAAAAHAQYGNSSDVIVHPPGSGSGNSDVLVLPETGQDFPPTAYKPTINATSEINPQSSGRLLDMLQAPPSAEPDPPPLNSPPATPPAPVAPPNAAPPPPNPAPTPAPAPPPGPPPNLGKLIDQMQKPPRAKPDTREPQPAPAPPLPHLSPQDLLPVPYKKP